jgi:hypothetical protein
MIGHSQRPIGVFHFPSPILARCLLVLLFGVMGTNAASAHVKWFCAFDVAGQPVGLANVLCQDFEILIVVALIWLLAGCFIEKTSLGEAMLRSMDRVTSGLRLHTEVMVRAICFFFFVSLWALGGILLTPELTSKSPLISPLQFVIAACLLSRRTLPISALGIVILFGMAIRDYGIFHLADYPIFLGIAAYLALTGLQKKFFGIEPIDIMRYATAVTLMWASVEKWAYPQWSFPIFITHPNITFGFDPEFYMRAAGVVEFTLAFALLWTPLVRRCAAAILAGMFIAACFEFGKIDTIGHSGIIAVLFAILADNRRVENDRRVPLLAPAGFGVALAVTLFVYYFGHAGLFNTTVL